MNYRNIYNSIILKRQNNIPSGYTEEHHIIPRSLGGTDDVNNLVKLTAKEHFICHLLLTKIYEAGTTEYYKMCHAFLMMMTSSKKQTRYISSRKYETLRIDFSKRISILQSGKSNSQYGTFWIYNPTLKESKKHFGEIPEGWFKGRVCDWNLLTKVSLEKENKLNNKQEKIENLKKYYCELHDIYVRYGWEGVLKNGYKKTQPNLVKQFSKYVDNYVTQQGKKRILK